MQPPQVRQRTGCRPSRRARSLREDEPRRPEAHQRREFRRRRSARRLAPMGCRTAPRLRHLCSYVVGPLGVTAIGDRQARASEIPHRLEEVSLAARQRVGLCEESGGHFQIADEYGHIGACLERRSGGRGSKGEAASLIMCRGGDGGVEIAALPRAGRSRQEGLGEPRCAGARRGGDCNFGPAEHLRRTPPQRVGTERGGQLDARLGVASDEPRVSRPQLIVVTPKVGGPLALSGAVELALDAFGQPDGPPRVSVPRGCQPIAGLEARDPVAAHRVEERVATGTRARLFDEERAVDQPQRRRGHLVGTDPIPAPDRAGSFDVERSTEHGKPVEHLLLGLRELPRRTSPRRQSASGAGRVSPGRQ